MAAETETPASELCKMLASNREDIQVVAMEYALGLTGTDEGKIFYKENQDFMKILWDLTKHRLQPMRASAYIALINVSSETILSDCLVELDIAKELLETILKKDHEFANKAAMLLANMTRSEEGQKKVLEVCTTNSELSMKKLVDALCDTKHNTVSDLNFIAPILSNLTCLKEAREYILDTQQCVVQRLLPFTQYEQSNVRRYGIVSVLRNCSFETDSHEWLLSDAVDILPHLLLPLAGPEEFEEDDMEKLPPDLQYLGEDKTREPDEVIRQMLLEALFRLCATKKGRLHLKEKNVFVIIKELDKWEKDTEARQAARNLLHVLVADEPEEGMENLDKVVIPENVKFAENKEPFTDLS